MSTHSREQDNEKRTHSNQNESAEEKDVNDTQTNPGNVQAITDDELPTALQKLKTKQIIFAIIDVLFVSGLIVYFKTPQCAFLYVIALWLGWQAFSIRREYIKGEIVELAVICQSANYSLARKYTIGGGYTRVVFATGDDNPEYYRFSVPGQTKDIDVDSVYIIYFKKSEPNKLLTYVPI